VLSDAFTAAHMSIVTQLALLDSSAGFHYLNHQILFCSFERKFVYSNSLLYTVTDYQVHRMQSEQNVAARFVTGTWRNETFGSCLLADNGSATWYHLIFRVRAGSNSLCGGLWFCDQVTCSPSLSRQCISYWMVMTSQLLVLLF
jgi:hypothetical protein